MAELTDGSSVAVTCCGVVVTHKWTRFGWEGTQEIAHGYFVCESCGNQFLAEAIAEVGPPGGA